MSLTYDFSPCVEPRYRQKIAEINNKEFGVPLTYGVLGDLDEADALPKNVHNCW